MALRQKETSPLNRYLLLSLGLVAVAGMTTGGILISGPSWQQKVERFNFDMSQVQAGKLFGVTPEARRELLPRTQISVASSPAHPAQRSQTRRKRGSGAAAGLLR